MRRWNVAALILGGALTAQAWAVVFVRDGRRVEVLLSEFRLSASSPVATAGRVTFQVQNRGKHDHEFVVFRTDLAVDGLPTKNKMIVCKVVDEEAQGLTKLGEIEKIRPGETKDLTLDLSPGAHALVCNMPCHYQKGMRAGLRVQDAGGNQ